MAEYTVEQLKDAARRAVSDGDTARARRFIKEARRIEAGRTSIADQAATGSYEGVSAVVGFPADAMAGVLNAMAPPRIDFDVTPGPDGVPRPKVTGIEPQTVVENPAGGSQWWQRNIFGPVMSETDPQTPLQQFARGAGREVAANALPGGALSRTLRGTTAAATGGLGAQVAGQVADVLGAPQEVEELVRLAGGVTAGTMAGKATDAAADMAARRQYVKTTPSAAALKSDASDLYQKGHSRNIKVKPAATKWLKNEIDGIAQKRGFVTPKGRVAQGSPEIRDALDMMEDITAGPVTTQQLQALRDTLQRAAQSNTPKVKAAGTMMLRKYDTFIARFAPEFKEGNALYTRAMRGEMMDEMEDLADIRSGQYTQSGPENALRTEYRALDRRIARGKERGLRPDQEAAVRDVTAGTPAVDALRTVGKLAPTGPVSAIGGIGLPFAVGNAIGGPAMGSAAAVTTATTGAFAKAAAAALQRSNSEFASATMRAAAPYVRPASELSKVLSAIVAGRVSQE